MAKYHPNNPFTKAYNKGKENTWLGYLMAGALWANALWLICG